VAIAAPHAAGEALLQASPSALAAVHSPLRCQEVRALYLDAEIERITLAPDKLAVAVATVAEVEREDAALQKQWQLRLERAR
jgi:hypothetical protein